MNLNTHGIVGPVTALCVYGNTIFAGCGSQVQVYRSDTCDLLISLPALHSSNVHGFKLGPVLGGRKCLSVCGAKRMRIFYLDVEASGGSDTHTAHFVSVQAATTAAEFEDWIFAATWLQDQENADKWTLALALAHNVVLHWDWQTDTILHRVTCTEECMLYCAHFIGHRWSDVVLAAGTVFRQVVLWSPGTGNGQEDSVIRPQPVLHRLMGHKGVIFSIFYHEGLQRICSVSDDRSIIMYQLRFHLSSPATDAYTCPTDWNHVAIEPMLTVFGHSARVWDVVLLADCFVSVGEDAHCIVWNYNGDILCKHRGHKGQSIRSLASSEDESFVVTGGGDCSIRKWQLCRDHALPLIQVQLTIPDHVKTRADDFVRNLALWDYNTVILITNAGSTLCYNLHSDSWQILAHDTDFASYATLAVSPHTSFLAISSITGHVRVIQKAPGQPGSQLALHETKIKLHSGKVCGLTWVDDDHFLTTGLNGHCILTAVHPSSGGKLVISTLAKLELPVCRHRWVTSGCLLLVPSSSSSSSPRSGTWGHLVCGDRSGSVHYYQLTHSTTEVESVLLPSQTFPKIHGSAGVTCVRHHSHTVYTAGRDGQYRRWSLNLGCLQLLNTSRVFKGFDWIDRLWIKDSGLQVLGFYSSKFIVWDAEQGERQLEVECGGGHRSWDCVSQGQNYRFSFIKARDVIIVTGGQRSSQDIVKPCLHGKKVWDSRCLFTYTDGKGAVQHVMCTGSEDTTLSLGVLQSDLEGGRLQWRGQHTLHAHLSSVRALAVIRSGRTSTGHDNMGNNKQSDSDPHHQTCSVDASSYLPRKKDTSSGCEVASKVVFSAGGRAQIQAWRVTIVQRGRSSVNEQGSVSHQMVTEQNHTSEQIFTVQSSLSSQRDIDQYGSFHRPSDLGKTSQCHRNTDSSFSTTYEHLSGCFLGESRHKRSHKPWKTRYLKLDPETRIMCLTAVTAQHLDPRLTAHLHLLAAAGSDGILRLFLFDEHHRHFTLLCQSSHHNGCILKVLIHLHPLPACSQASATSNPSTSHLPILLSAATDGHIAMWNLQPVVQWLLANASCTSPDGHGHGVSCHGGGDSVQFRTTGEGYDVDPEKEETENHDLCRGQQDQEELTLDESSGDEDDDIEEKTFSHPATVQSNFTKTQYLGDTASLFPSSTLAGTPGVTESSAAVQQRDQTSEVDGTHQKWIPDQEVVAHQSGVNSLHIKSLTDGSLLLASGGDDNALTINRLTVIASDMDSKSNDRELSHGSPLFSVDGHVSKPDAHAAQITGVWILSPIHILTASIDQRVTVWRLTQDSQVTMEKCRFVDVADPSNIDVWQHRDRVYVGLSGEGLALLSIHGHDADSSVL